MEDLPPDYEDDLPIELVTMIKAIMVEPDVPECMKELIELVRKYIPLLRKLKLYNAISPELIEKCKQYDENITNIMRLWYNKIPDDVAMPISDVIRSISNSRLESIMVRCGWKTEDIEDFKSYNYENPGFSYITSYGLSRPLFREALVQESLLNEKLLDALKLWDDAGLEEKKFDEMHPLMNLINSTTQ